METLGATVEWIVLVLLTLGLFVMTKKMVHSSGHFAQRWMLAAIGPAVVIVLVLIRNVEPVGWRIALMLSLFAILLLPASYAYRVTNKEDTPS